MKARSKRWCAKNGTVLKRRRRKAARIKTDPELVALRKDVNAANRANRHPGYSQAVGDRRTLYGRDLLPGDAELVIEYVGTGLDFDED